jgi:hypothetical protein
MLFSCQINNQVNKYLKNTVYFLSIKAKEFNSIELFLHKKFSFSFFIKKH